MSYKIIELDSALKPYENDIKLRMDLYHKTRKELLGKNKDIVSYLLGSNCYSVLSQRHLGIQMLHFGLS